MAGPDVVEILKGRGINAGSPPLASIQKINQRARDQQGAIQEGAGADREGRAGGAGGERPRGRQEQALAVLAHGDDAPLLAMVGVAASLMAAGCFLEENTGGFAAGGGVGASNGHDASGCDTAGGPAGGGGRRGEGGAAGGGRGWNTAMRCCSALPFGCICSPIEPSQVGACNTSSVVRMPGQQGVCCNNAFNCTCVAYECVRMGGACTCGLAAASAGTQVDNCSATTANPAIKCCRGYGQCVCSSADCLLTETQVSGCSVQDLLACPAGDVSVEASRGRGGGARGYRLGRVLTYGRAPAPTRWSAGASAACGWRPGSAPSRRPAPCRSPAST